MFDRFRQEDSSITRQFGGLGLGLSLARQLLEAHGGTSTAASAGEGQGATFTIRLPLVPSPHAVPAASTGELKLDLRGVRALVVEDEPSTLEFITFVLEQEGAIVAAVGSANNALKQLRRSPFDVLISDIAMQDMDGYSLLHQIRSLPPAQNRNIRAIALTAYVAESDRHQAIAAGYQQHLGKPIKPEALITTIAIVLGR